jgi:REDY-like protein HapK
MTTHVFFLNALREGAEATEYERWLREVDYPTARSLPAIKSYHVVRVDGPLREAAAPCDYVEIVEITDLERYRHDIAALPGRERFVEQLRSFVGDAQAFHGTIID